VTLAALRRCGFAEFTSAEGGRRERPPEGSEGSAEFTSAEGGGACRPQGTRLERRVVKPIGVLEAQRGFYSECQAWGCVLAVALVGCGGLSQRELDSSSRAGSGASTEPSDDAELRVQFACGSVSATVNELSDFMDSGEECAQSGGISTFALRLNGSAANRYSAVVRCGYVRYDNGTFVGTRVQSEGRNGAFCHESALRELAPIDRMLLTDFSFELEPRIETGPRSLTVALQSFDERWSESVSAVQSLCLYVAFRAPGASTCALAPPADYCDCPNTPYWPDFATAARVTLEMR
jgi:hypothetical protein